MCRAVAEALVTGTHLVVQAGTGTGQVAGLPRPARALRRQEGRRRHGDQGTAGPAGHEGPASGRGRSRAPGAAGLRRPERAQQLRLPPAGGRGGVGRDPARAGRRGGRAGRRARGRRRRRGGAERCRAARGPRRRGAHAGGVVAGLGHRRPGRPELRAVRPGLEHGERRPARVPGRLQLPVGRPLLRRGRPRPGGGGRRRRRQHPPLRRPPGQRRRGAARARRGRLRRGPRARGGHDLEPRGRAHPRPVPSVGDRGPLAGRASATRTCSTPWPRPATSWAPCWSTGSGRGCSTTSPGLRPPRTGSWPSCSPGPPSSPAG